MVHFKAVAAESLVLVLAIISQQQQAADAWWLFSGEPTAVNASEKAADQQQQQPLKAVAKFDMDGVTGTFKFSQQYAAAPTVIEYDLLGLRGNNQKYHVHVKPVPTFDADKVRSNSSAQAQLCADSSTGGHHNPHNIKKMLPPKSAPFDQYEMGDLSGKHGELLKANAPGALQDHYAGMFTDDKLTLSGANSIIGRSVVIHKNDGKRWVCASIVEAK